MLFLALRCGHTKVVTYLCKKLDESPVCQRSWQWKRSWRQRRGAWLFAIIIISTQYTSCQMKTSLFLKTKASDIARCAEPWNNKVIDSTLPLSKCGTVNCCEGKFLESLSQLPILAAAFNSISMQVAHHQQRQKFVNRTMGNLRVTCGKRLSYIYRYISSTWKGASVPSYRGSFLESWLVGHTWLRDLLYQLEVLISYLEILKSLTKDRKISMSFPVFTKFFYLQLM